MKTCPECAEEVRGAARICRFCGHRFPDAESGEIRRRVPVHRRRRALGAIAALVIAALLAGVSVGSGQSADEDKTGARAAVARESETPPRCSEGSVATELERRTLLNRRDFSGVEQVSCQDLTGDRIPDGLFVRGSTGSSGTMGWGVLVGQKSGRWDLSLFRQAEAGVQIHAEGGRVIRRQPIYQPEDPHCCPTGGTEVEVYMYRDGRFEAIEQYSEPPSESEETATAAPDTASPSAESGTSGDAAGGDCEYGRPLFDENECVSDEAYERETELESECGGYDPSRVTADGDYVPKPGC